MGRADLVSVFGNAEFPRKLHKIAAPSEVFLCDLGQSHFYERQSNAISAEQSSDMITFATATRYDRLAGNGRNNPLRVTVETAEGQEYEVFLKPSGRPELSVVSLAIEVLAACLAGKLGLPVCEPFVVEILPEWIDAVPDVELRGVLRASNPLAFGSRAAGEGWRQWNTEDILTAARKPLAVGIFAFDAFLENPDRKPSNPNLLVKGDQFRMIDHELALRVRAILPPSAPWREGGLQHLMQHDAHVFADRLRGGVIDLEEVRLAWMSLSDGDLADYEAALPAQWADASDEVAIALEHVRTIRDRMDECLAEIGRALT